MQKQKPRTIKPEMLNQLDSVERIVAEQFILEGRWVVEGGKTDQ